MASRKIFIVQGHHAGSSVCSIVAKAQSVGRSDCHVSFPSVLDREITHFGRRAAARGFLGRDVIHFQ